MNKSESIGKLALALSKAQGAIKSAVRDSENPFFKSRYADLASVWEACRKALSDNELAVTQTTCDDGTVETTLIHSSGEWISGALKLKPMKDDPQGVGSAITYARRYGLAAIVGVAPDDDDDGNAASHQSNGDRIDALKDVFNPDTFNPEKELVGFGTHAKSTWANTPKSWLTWGANNLKDEKAEKAQLTLEYLEKIGDDPFQGVLDANSKTNKEK